MPSAQPWVTRWACHSNSGLHGPRTAWSARCRRAGSPPAPSPTLAESLLHRCPLDPVDLAQRFVAGYQAGPPDVGLHTSSVLSRIATGQPWAEAVQAVQRHKPDSAGNGSVMRCWCPEGCWRPEGCWPVALAHWDDLDLLLSDSRLQSRVTHPHSECEAGSAFTNAAIFHLLRGMAPAQAVARARGEANLPEPLRLVIDAAPGRHRDELAYSGWVRHMLESAAWGLLITDSFEEAVVQVVNLGGDADTAGVVVGQAGRLMVCRQCRVAGEKPCRVSGRWGAVSSEAA